MDNQDSISTPYLHGETGAMVIVNHDDYFTFFDVALSSIRVLIVGMILSLCIKLACPCTIHRLLQMLRAKMQAIALCIMLITHKNSIRNCCEEENQVN